MFGYCCCAQLNEWETWKFGERREARSIFAPSKEKREGRTPKDEPDARYKIDGSSKQIQR